MGDDKKYFQLSKEIEYSKKGEFLKTASLEFVEPGIDLYDEAADLGQLITAAMMDAGRFARDAKPDPDKKEDSMDANAIKMFVYASREIKVKDVAKAFRTLAYKVGTMDGEEPITEMIFNKLSRSDFDRCMFEFIENFTLPSLLSEGEG